MGVRKNPDGSVTVGILPEEKEIKAEEKNAASSPKPEKKPAKKKQ